MVELQKGLAPSVPQRSAGAQPRPPTEFLRLYREHRDRLTRYAFALGAKAHEVDDFVSETMTQALRGWSTIRDPEAWIYKVLKNVLLKERRRIKNEQKAVLKQAGRLLEPAPEHGPEYEANCWEDSQFVERLMSMLPPKQQEVFRLVLEDATTAEIAELLGKSPGAVRQNLREARISLKRHLSEVGDAREIEGSAPTSGGKEQAR